MRDRSFAVVVATPKRLDWIRRGRNEPQRRRRVLARPRPIRSADVRPSVLPGPSPRAGARPPVLPRPIRRADGRPSVLIRPKRKGRRPAFRIDRINTEGRRPAVVLSAAPPGHRSCEFAHVGATAGRPAAGPAHATRLRGLRTAISPRDTSRSRPTCRADSDAHSRGPRVRGPAGSGRFGRANQPATGAIGEIGEIGDRLQCSAGERGPVTLRETTAGSSQTGRPRSRSPAQARTGSSWATAAPTWCGSTERSAPSRTSAAA
jgi:hypothetical protein